MATTPRSYIDAVNDGVELCAGPGERFSGFGVMGLPFRSGHILAMRRFPASSLGPGYTSIWHRTPEGTWTFHQDQAAEVSCTWAFGAAVDEVRTEPIEVTTTGAWTLSIRTASGSVEWTLTLGETRTSRALNRVASAIPGGLWRSAPFLGLMGRVAGPALRAGRLRLSGHTPNGQDFIANPRRIWPVVDAHAAVHGTDLGPIGPLVEQDRLGDFWIPQRGLLAMGDAVFAPTTPKAD